MLDNINVQKHCNHFNDIFEDNYYLKILFSFLSKKKIVFFVAK